MGKKAIRLTLKEKHLFCNAAKRCQNLFAFDTPEN
jgi:hypothetical protein